MSSGQYRTHFTCEEGQRRGQVSRGLSVSSRLTWLSCSNKPKGDFGDISVVRVGWPGVGNVHGAKLTPRGAGALRSHGSTFFCRAPYHFQIHYQVSLGKLGRRSYPRATDEINTQVWRFGWLVLGHVASFLPLAERSVRLGQLRPAEQR